MEYTTVELAMMSMPICQGVYVTKSGFYSWLQKRFYSIGLGQTQGRETSLPNILCLWRIPFRERATHERADTSSRHVTQTQEAASAATKGRRHSDLNVHLHHGALQ